MALGTNEGPKQGQLPRGRSPVTRMGQEQRCQHCWPGCHRVHRRAHHLLMECRERGGIPESLYLKDIQRKKGHRVVS